MANPCERKKTFARVLLNILNRGFVFRKTTNVNKLLLHAIEPERPGNGADEEISAVFGATATLLSPEGKRRGFVASLYSPQRLDARLPSHQP